MNRGVLACVGMAAGGLLFAAVKPQAVIPPGKQAALDAALTQAAVAVSNRFRANPRASSLDWSHPEPPDQANAQAARPEWAGLGLPSAPCRMRVDEYVGPSGAGWVLTLEATPHPARSNRFMAVIATGPEAWRTTDWIEVSP